MIQTIPISHLIPGSNFRTLYSYSHIIHLRHHPAIRQQPHPPSRQFRPSLPLLWPQVHRVQTEALRKAAQPLEIVDQTPRRVAGHIAAVQHDGAQQLAEVVVHVEHAAAIATPAAIRPAVLRDDHLGIVVLVADPPAL